MQEATQQNLDQAALVSRVKALWNNLNEYRAQITELGIPALTLTPVEHF